MSKHLKSSSTVTYRMVTQMRHLCRVPTLALIVAWLLIALVCGTSLASVRAAPRSYEATPQPTATVDPSGSDPYEAGAGDDTLAAALQSKRFVTFGGVESHSLYSPRTTTHADTDFALIGVQQGYHYTVLVATLGFQPTLVVGVSIGGILGTVKNCNGDKTRACLTFVAASSDIHYLRVTNTPPATAGADTVQYALSVSETAITPTPTPAATTTPAPSSPKPTTQPTRAPKAGDLYEDGMGDDSITDALLGKRDIQLGVVEAHSLYSPRTDDHHDTDFALLHAVQNTRYRVLLAVDGMAVPQFAAGYVEGGALALSLVDCGANQFCGTFVTDHAGLLYLKIWSDSPNLKATYALGIFGETLPTPTLAPSPTLTPSPSPTVTRTVPTPTVPPVSGGSSGNGGGTSNGGNASGGGSIPTPPSTSAPTPSPTSNPTATSTPLPTAVPPTPVRVAAVVRLPDWTGAGASTGLRADEMPTLASSNAKPPVAATATPDAFATPQFPTPFATARVDNGVLLTATAVAGVRPPLSPYGATPQPALTPAISPATTPTAVRSTVNRSQSGASPAIFWIIGWIVAVVLGIKGALNLRDWWRTPRRRAAPASPTPIPVTA